ncbi:hypothetical protein GDO86_011364 [Hymenochirus boettgeri]|uniref:Zinc transporter ZIP6 n=1 Tax=Hymenochirus boettgeri TaxID=247094 RepID=A0A8T2JGA8_9PIPI|nr:hypothetical protein GDO86_011364 [Hymenochirus boettgeri]
MGLDFVLFLRLFGPLVVTTLCVGAAGDAPVTVTLMPRGGVDLNTSQVSQPSSHPATIDLVLAARTQRQHLILLFERYGENNQTLTLSGFRKLLKNLGMERLRGHNHHNHHQHRHHHHPQPPQATLCKTGRKKRHCLNASRLLTSHGMDVQFLLSTAEFDYICPAIINQIDRRSCLIHASEKPVAENNQNVYSVKVAWIGGCVSITIISVLSLLGVILLPLMNRVFFKFLLSFLVALAVGTLSGDAFLHLLPHSHATHYHSHEDLLNKSSEAVKEEEELAHLDATWKGLTALGGLYFMFLVEHLITLIKQYKDKKQKNLRKTENEEDLEVKKTLSNHSNVEEKGGSDSGSHHESYVEDGALDAPQTQQTTGLEEDEEEEEKIMIVHVHDEASYQEYRYSREELKDAGIATLAWMVIMGDGLHNFGDGLAIGAAFTEGLSSGLSTSVAVFCHELPHELGDFAVLLKSGMTVKQAVLYNGLSAMLAYLGMVTGILIGHYAENVSMWIFALTAGLFMYVAFVDMVPEMLHNDASDHGCSRWGYFLLQNAGILLGFFIMLVISVFEHKIVFNLEI